MPTAIIAATDFEFQPLKESALAPRFEFHTFGIGAIASAHQAIALAEKLKSHHVIYVGTCGSYAAFTNPYLLSVDKVVWSCLAERKGLAYKIKDTMPDVTVPPTAMTQDLEKKTVLCAASISLDRTVSELPAPSDRCVENVELYSIASIFATRVKQFSPILAVTNQIGPDAHAQWRANFRNAATITAEFILQQTARS